MLVKAILQMILEVFGIKARSDLRDGSNFELSLEDNVIILTYKDKEIFLWVDKDYNVEWHHERLQKMMDIQDRREELLVFLKNWSCGKGIPRVNEDGSKGWIHFDGLNIDLQERPFEWALEKARANDKEHKEKMEALRKIDEERDRLRELANQTLVHTEEGFTVRLTKDWTARHEMHDDIINVVNLPDLKFEYMLIKVRMLAKNKDGSWIAEYIGIP